DGGAGASAGEGEGGGVWRTRGLPQHGFPYALATTTVHAPERAALALHVVRVDPRTVKPGAASDPEPTVLALEGAPKGDLTLWWASGVFSVGVAAPTKDATRLLGGYGASTAPAAQARAAVGVQDEDGMVVWVELPADVKADAQTAAAMDALLVRLGCTGRMLLDGDGAGARALLGGSLDACGNPLAAAPPPPAVRLVRAKAPDAHPFFDATPVVPVEVWRPLQAKRIRYFYKPAPAASSSSSATPTAPAAASVRVQSPR
ncbi:MAG TPA: hypothetical protein VIY73_02365, partial [Polyangiaceae bacterium]